MLWITIERLAGPHDHIVVQPATANLVPGLCAVEHGYLKEYGAESMQRKATNACSRGHFAPYRCHSGA